VGVYAEMPLSTREVVRSLQAANCDGNSPIRTRTTTAVLREALAAATKTTVVLPVVTTTPTD
jgi:hypothetical protein